MRLITIILGLIFAWLWGSCHGCSTKNHDSEIKLGVMSGPENELMETVKAVAKERYDLSIKLVVFNDYMTPNIALNDHSIDANAFQHEPFLDEMVKSHKFKLMSAGKTFLFPLAAYSKKIRDVKDVPMNATVAIPNDPTNEGRALLLLARQGLIELKDPNYLFSQAKDISKNPLHLKITELEAAQLPRVLDDVTMAIINTTFAQGAGLSPKKDGLFVEGRDSRYVNIIAVREEDRDAPWVEKLVKSVENARVLEAAEKIFNGGVIAGWAVKDRADD